MEDLSYGICALVSPVYDAEQEGDPSGVQKGIAMEKLERMWMVAQ